MGLFDSIASSTPVKNGQFFSAGRHHCKVKLVTGKESQKDKKVFNVIVELEVISSKGAVGHDGPEPAIEVGESRSCIFNVNDDTGAGQAKKLFLALYQADHPRASLDSTDAGKADYEAFKKFGNDAFGVDQPLTGRELVVVGYPTITKGKKLPIIALEFEPVYAAATQATPAKKAVDPKEAELAAFIKTLPSLGIDDDETKLTVATQRATKLGIADAESVAKRLLAI